MVIAGKKVKSMRIRRSRAGRRAGAGCLAAAAVILLSAAGFSGWSAGSIGGTDWEEILKNAGRFLVECIWNRSNPLLEPAGKSGKITGTGTDPDPAYENYRSSKRFYEEHEYLAWYGWEDTGEGDIYGGSTGQGGGLGGESRKGDGPEGEGTAYGGGAVLSEKTAETLAGVIERPVTGRTYVMEQLADYDFLMKNFYSVHTSTTAGRDLMNAGKFLEMDLTLEEKGEGPQILIYHTHSQEAYADSGPGETVVGVGERLAQLLEEKGYRVYHDTTVYDLKDGKLDRSRAYNYALEGINAVLQKNPSIQVVLDIHRDGVAENLRLVTEIDGKSTAQIMFFNGLSQTPEGPIEYLPNPYREENLAFSLQMQLGAEAYYPGYARKIYLKGLRYNEHLRPRSCLIEVGAQTNTYEEARNAMEPLAELLNMVLQGR